jgi:3-deoxy-D-manno-octulosonic-acid transferase
MYFLYNLLWTIASIILAPCILFGKREYYERKFALDLPVQQNDIKRIWVHALCVGEVFSTRPLIKALKYRFPDMPVVLTVKTKQGMSVARQELSNEVEALYYMPLDYSSAVSRVADAVNPSILLLIESDIWPGLFSVLRKRGIKIILINGRVSPRTLKGYKRFRRYFMRVLNDIYLLLMQTDLDRARMIEAGVAPYRVKTTGNIKFDQDWLPMDKKEHDKWKERLGLDINKRIIVAGSTHEGEEEPLLKAFHMLLEHHHDLIMIMAPRKLERVSFIESVGKSLGLEIIRRTALERERKKYNVLILDTIGELGRIYGLSCISFVGGSLVPMGGHNLLEPASFGCPVLFGRHTHNFVQMSELLLEHGGGKRLDGPEELYPVMKSLLEDDAMRNAMGKNAKTFVKANSGAINRVIEIIGGEIAPN